MGTKNKSNYNTMIELSVIIIRAYQIPFATITIFLVTKTFEKENRILIIYHTLYLLQHHVIHTLKFELVVNKKSVKHNSIL